MTIQEAMQLALQRHQAGQLAEAAAIYRQVLTQQPTHPDALHLLGNIAYQGGRAEEAVDLIRRAIASDPHRAEFRGSLGLALMSRGEFPAAAAACRQAISLRPDLAQVHANLAAVLAAQGQFDAAVASLSQAIALRPNRGDFYFNLANIFRQTDRLDDAISAYRKSLDLQPASPQALNNLGSALQARGNLTDAVAAYRHAVQLRPDFASAHRNLGRALRQLNQFDAAVDHCRKTLDLEPNSPSAADDYNTLGSALRGQGELDQALAAYQESLARQPDRADALNNLAELHRETGRLREALDCFNRVLELHPRAAEVDSSRVYALHFDADCDARDIHREHQLWNQRHALPLREAQQPHQNNRDPVRRLRIGYVSPDLRNHVVGWNLLPLLKSHDHEQFEIFAYASLAADDATTHQLRQACDQWRNIYALTDEQTAALIRRDQIDILVDLSLHMAHNRLLVFARRPAPVQVTYLGYCSTTGLTAIDYRLSDPHLDPPDTDLSVYTEQTVCLPTSYWCYQPGGPAPDIGPAPLQRNGYATFGCLNHFSKISPAAMRLWAQVLAAVPKSRLLVHCPQGSHRSGVLEIFRNQGISPDRLELAGYQSWADYIQTYHRIDLALDPFPYGGGITTCDGLWMGVPAVTLSGHTAVGRGGRSILSNVGLPELVAQTPQEYVRLASDLDRWIELRPGMRRRMLSSFLMDGPRLARDVEAAYAKMWTDKTKTWLQ